MGKIIGFLVSLAVVGAILFGISQGSGRESAEPTLLETKRQYHSRCFLEKQDGVTDGPACTAYNRANQEWLRQQR